MFVHHVLCRQTGTFKWWHLHCHDLNEALKQVDKMYLNEAGDSSQGSSDGASKDHSLFVFC